MAEPYADPETVPPKPTNRRRAGNAGSILARTGSGDNHQNISGVRHVRRRVVVPEEYVVPLPPTPGIYRQGSFGSRVLSRTPKDPGSAYSSRFGYPADIPQSAPPIPDRRHDRLTYAFPRVYDNGGRSSQDFRGPVGNRRIPMQYEERVGHSRSRSRSRSPRHVTSEVSSGVRTKRARSRSRGSDDSSSNQSSDVSFARSRPYGDDDDFREDEFTTTQVYEFNPSRLSRTPSQDRSIAASGSEGEGPLPEAERSTAGQVEGFSTSATTRTLQIYRSEYTGDAFADGSHSARLTVIHDPKKTKQPVFRWIHIKQTSLNFDELSHEVSHISGLGDGDKNGLSKLLAEVKKSCVKSTPAAKGSNIKHMEPRFIQILLPPDQRSKGQTPAIRTVTWLCVPYFSLEKYAGPLSAANTATFPAQTLLQAQYSGVPQDRDMQQVVQQLGHVPPEMCFHISQFWCIILDNSLLITCGTNSAEAAMQSDVLDIVTEPLKSPSAGGALIYVYYTEAVLWVLSIDECASWFAFISHFHDFWPQTLSFSHRDRPITADDWPRILNLARHSKSKTMLYLRIWNAPRPPARGILKPIGKGAIKSEGTNTDEPQQGLKPPQDKGKGRPDSSPAPTPASELDVLPDRVNDRFHVFSWLETVLTTGDANSQVQVESLRIQLQEVEDYLKNSTSFSDRRAYQDSQAATRLSCFRYLRDQGGLTEEFKKRPRMKQDYEDRIDILNAADIVYRFFLPLGFDGPTVRKFWGAINLLVQMPARSNQQRRGQGSGRADLVVPLVRSYLRKLTQAIQSFKNILSHAQPLERASITVPDGLIRAWLHLLMAMIYSSQGAFAWAEHSEVARTLIKGGMAEVIEEMAGDSLLKKVVILPMEVVSLVTLKLLQDSTGVYPNIGTTYSEYLDALGNEIATKPSDRSFQHRISLLKQEVGVVLRTVAAQSLIYSAIINSRFKTQLSGSSDGLELRARGRQLANYDGRDIARPAREARYAGLEMSPPPYAHVPRNRRDNQQTWAYVEPTTRQDHGRPAQEAGVEDWMLAPEEFYKLAPTDPGGFRDLLAAECLSFLEKRAREFNGFDLHADDLQEENMNKFEDSKDRQELAIYAFTIVTVIFLPLSFVAGVFGMNTSDIRDMEFGQWAYWASAIPVTVLVILIGLWWMGELGNAFAWLGYRNGGRRGVYALASPYNRSSGGIFTSRIRVSEAAPPPPPPPYRNPVLEDTVVYGAHSRAHSPERRRLRQRQGAYSY